MTDTRNQYQRDPLDPFYKPTRDELIAALDAIISQGRWSSPGGWPKVPAELQAQMAGFFQMVVKAVADPDPDGADVIEVSINDRSKYRIPAGWIRMPNLAHHPESLDELHEFARNVAALSSIASREAELLASFIRWFQEDQK